ncbi:fused MFS/spermidine synthase [Alteromonadaceae bacterium BrNp21-10]|nr:fused MFS/spermidine synthase [Alteromonadaceae bacterium BrNp21-10]
MFNLKQALEQQNLIYLNQENPAYALYIKDNQHFRWLEINSTVHSVMSLAQPQSLVLPHLHAMMMVMYLNPNINTAVELGLGGGAIQRFVQHYCNFPLTSVEYDQQIINCYQEYFAFTDSHSTIICDNAQNYVQSLRNTDLLIVDLFSAEGCPAFVLDRDFYQHCYQTLSNNGILLVNLVLNDELKVQALCENIKQLFGHSPWCFSIPGYVNRILIIGIEPLPRIEFDQSFMDFVRRHELDLNAFTLDASNLT